jgi:hypothetical protein
MPLSGRGWSWIALAAGLAIGVGLSLRASTQAEMTQPQRHVRNDESAVQHDPHPMPGPAWEKIALPVLSSPSPAPLASTAASGVPLARLPMAEIDAALASTPSPPPSSIVAPVLADVETPRPRSKPRQVLLAPLTEWSMPGLCATPYDAVAIREKLTENFRLLPMEGSERLLLDPRLPDGAEAGVVKAIDEARIAARRSLGLSPLPPPVFVYFDRQLMKAAACINEEVVAFYDGALHVVAGRDDLEISVTHEYAHHALMSSGLRGPAWAQEGIAMIVAGETWWQRPSRLEALLQEPFASDDMDRVIPYKLPADQAVLFYVQAALTVQCICHLRGWSLRDLADRLRAGHGSGSVSYDLPELEQSSFVSHCVALAPTFAHRAASQ